jgi:hypothetical protein
MNDILFHSDSTDAAIISVIETFRLIVLKEVANLTEVVPKKAVTGTTPLRRGLFGVAALTFHGPDLKPI